jgi:outer membrane lipoprotein-sorting protein
MVNARRILMWCAVLALLPASLSAQTVDDIVAQNIKAKGGLAQLKAVRAMRITAKVTPQPNVEVAMVVTTARPNKLRQETTIDGQQIIVAFDGQSAWTINPMVGATTPQAIQGPELDRLKNQADAMDGPLVDYKEKGTTIELQGTEDVADTKAYKLKITRKDGESQTLYIDTATGLEVKAISELIQAGQRFTSEVYFSNYHTVDGITLAHTILQKVMGNEVTFSVQKVEILPGVDDSIFKMPAAAR